MSPNRAAAAFSRGAGRSLCCEAGARLDGEHHGSFARRSAESRGMETNKAHVFYVA
jgi:hypothetical protein